MSEPVIPGYTIKRALGRGGMATVYLAEQQKFERDVALKVMAPALSADEGFRERFLREAKIVARISHPNIVAVYDVNEVDGIYYIAMEYHPGGDLKARLRAGLDVRDALRITRDVARALDFAHGKGYLHRDIKPDNILFRDDGSAVLTDFGIAKATEGDSSLTQMGMVAGTPKYMSPEQARAQTLDADSDLYSLGVVLFEMLVGRLPYEAADPIALGIMHMNAPVPRLEGRLAHFQPLIDRLLAKQPAQRPQTGAQVIREIEQLERGFDFDAADVPAGDSATAIRPSMRPGAMAVAAAPASLAAPVSVGGATVSSSVAGSDDGVTVLAPVTSPSMPAVPPQPLATASGKRGRRVAVTALLAVLAGGGGWWGMRYSEANALATRVSAGLAAGDAAFARSALVTPAEDNALAHYRNVLVLQPGHAGATEGIRKVVAALLAQAYAALGEGKPDEARRLQVLAGEIAPGEPGHVALQRAVSEALARREAAASARLASPSLENRSGARAAAVSAPAPDALARLRIGGMLGSARTALEDGDTATAIQRYQQVLRLDPGNREASAGLRQARAR